CLFRRTSSADLKSPFSMPHTLYFFISVTRHPPRSTLFPYTTLFRSSPTHSQAAGRTLHNRRQVDHITELTQNREARNVTAATGRSEEHTSELQSRENLVCRLLLEKKNDGYHLLLMKIEYYLPEN